jgi:hypothetical protein
MLHRRYFMHYRLIHGTINALTTVGTALLLSYLILRAHF